MQINFKMKILVILIAVLSFSLQLMAQVWDKMRPVVNQPCPGFLLTDVHYYSKSKVTLQDFGGQWLILDFWNRYCSTCLKSMPKMNKLQNDFKDKIQVLYVGYNGSKYTKSSDDLMIRKIYELNRKAENLQLAMAYDSLLFDQFDIGPCPYLVIVDPNGMVKGITTAVNEAQLDSLIRGQHVSLRKAFTSMESKQKRKTKKLN